MRLLMAMIVTLPVMLMPVRGSAETLSEEKKRDIIELMDITGALKVGQQMSSVVTTQMTESLKLSRPDIPEEMYDILAEEVNATIDEEMTRKGGFIEILVPIYHRHYTHDDIRQLLQFYRSDVGRKTVRVMPELMQESMVAGGRWGEQLVPLIQERVRIRLDRMDVGLGE